MARPNLQLVPPPEPLQEPESKAITFWWRLVLLAAGMSLMGYGATRIIYRLFGTEP